MMAPTSKIPIARDLKVKAQSNARKGVDGRSRRQILAAELAILTSTIILAPSAQALG